MTLVDLERIFHIIQLLLTIVDHCKKFVTKRTK